MEPEQYSVKRLQQSFETEDPTSKEGPWVVVRDRTPAVLSKKSASGNALELETGSVDASSTPDTEHEGEPEADPGILVNHEDVISAVADFVKGQLSSLDIGCDVKPKELVNVMDLVMAEEKAGSWSSLWGRGR